MSYLGDYAAGDTLDFKFFTRSTAAAPTTLSGTPAVSVYKGNADTQSTSGVTLTADFDSVTGLNHVRITTSSDGTFYADGSQFTVVITAGTVGGVSVVGECVGRFTLRAQAPLYPTTAGRKLDVTANGEAGLDLDNTTGTLGVGEIPNLDAAISSRSTVTTAQVNAEMVDVLNVDTWAELAAVPNAAATITQILRWIYLLARNQIEQDATTATIRADDGTTAIATSTVSDDGTTFEAGEWS